jgi:hypothetical protein
MNKSKMENKNILERLMAEDKLTKESKLFRYTSKNYLIKDNGHLFLKAKPQPIEMVVDDYNGFGEVFIASEIGRGLAFLTNREIEYENEERVCVEVSIKDIVEQGGLIYRVTSLPAYLTSYFVTLPSGSIKVEINQ